MVEGLQVASIVHFGCVSMIHPPSSILALRFAHARRDGAGCHLPAVAPACISVSHTLNNTIVSKPGQKKMKKVEAGCRRGCGSDGPAGGDTRMARQARAGSRTPFGQRGFCRAPNLRAAAQHCPPRGGRGLLMRISRPFGTCARGFQAPGAEAPGYSHGVPAGPAHDGFWGCAATPWDAVGAGQVPKGLSTIARRFNAGTQIRIGQVP